MICKYCGKTTSSFVCEYCRKDNSFPLRGGELEKLLERNKSIEPDKSTIKTEIPESAITEKKVIHTSEEELKSAYQQGYAEGYQIGVQEGYAKGLNQGYNNGKAESEILPSDPPKKKCRKLRVIFGVLCLFGIFAGGIIVGAIGHNYCAFHPERINRTIDMDQSDLSATSTPVLIEEPDTSDNSEELTVKPNPFVADDGEENLPLINDEPDTCEPEDDQSSNIIRRK